MAQTGPDVSWWRSVRSYLHSEYEAARDAKAALTEKPNKGSDLLEAFFFALKY